MHPYLWVEETEVVCTAAGSLGQSSTGVAMGFFIERGKRSLLEDILNEISNVQ